MTICFVQAITSSATAVHELHEKFPHHASVRHLPSCTVDRSTSPTDRARVGFHLSINDNNHNETLLLRRSEGIREKRRSRGGSVEF
jgi:hypothetical protein